MNLPRIVISVLGFLAVLTFSVLAFSHSVAMIGSVRPCLTRDDAVPTARAQEPRGVEGPPEDGRDQGEDGGQEQEKRSCRVPAVGEFTQWTMSSLGAAATTLVGGFLGLSGLTYRTEANRDRVGKVRRTLASTGGGSALLGVFLWASSALYVAVLLFALGTMVWVDASVTSAEVVLSPAPTLLRQLASTGVGLLLAAIAVLGQASAND